MSLRCSATRYPRASVRLIGCLLILLTLVSVTAVTGGAMGDQIGTQNTTTTDSINESEEELFVTVDANETGALSETVNATLIAISPDEDKEIDWFDIQIAYDNSYLAFDTAHEAEAGPVTVTDGGPGYAVFENEYELGDLLTESVTTPVAVATVSFTVIGSDGNATITANESSSVGWGVDLLQTEYDVEWDTGTIETYHPDGTITGTVTNATGKSVHNATVSTSDTTTTATNGTYNLSVPDGNTTLTASAAGYEEERTAVSVTGGETTTHSFTLSQSDDEDTDAGDEDRSDDEDEGAGSDDEEEKNGSDDHENRTEPDSGEDTTENSTSERDGQGDSEQTEGTSDSNENSQFSGSASQTTTTDEESTSDEGPTSENKTRNESDDEGAELNESQPAEPTDNESSRAEENESTNASADPDNRSTASDGEDSSLGAVSESSAIQPVGAEASSPSPESTTDDTADEQPVAQSGMLLHLGHGAGTTGILIGIALILYRSGKRAMQR